MMPVIFVGHGSPMNAIEDNQYTKSWRDIAKTIPKPSAILSISAHWFTEGTRVLTAENPRIIYDFYGFPKTLYEVDYKVKGATEFAYRTMEILEEHKVIEDNTWGIDHGTWSVLKIMYPKADIPVYQVSIDRLSDPQNLYRIGESIKALREQNVLILGSGNVVHNLSRLDFSIEGGFPWAYEFDEYIRSNIEKREFEKVINYRNIGDSAKYAFPTPEHFYPLLYVLGASDEDDNVTIYSNSCMAGSLSMTSYVFSQ